MMTKLAHMRANRKNNKGFSLVELIIVIAIMVALIAVMGPQYVKYIQKSRDSALATAAEDLQAYVKTAIADEDVNLRASGVAANDTIVVQVTDGKLAVTVGSGLTVSTGTTTDTAENIIKAGAGITAEKKMGDSKNVYTIQLTGGSSPTVSMTSTVKS